MHTFLYCSLNIIGYVYDYLLIVIYKNDKNVQSSLIDFPSVKKQKAGQNHASWWQSEGWEERSEVTFCIEITIIVYPFISHIAS